MSTKDGSVNATNDIWTCCEGEAAVPALPYESLPRTSVTDYAAALGGGALGWELARQLVASQRRISREMDAYFGEAPRR